MASSPRRRAKAASTPSTSDSAPTVVSPSATTRFPTPVEMYEFLTKRLKIRCLDPRRPYQFWPELRLTSLPLSDDMAADMRGHYRDYLFKSAGGGEALRVKRKEYLAESLNPRIPAPTSRHLFLIAGAHVEPWQRLEVCMHMAGISPASLLKVVPEGKLYEFLKGEEPNYGKLEEVCDFLDIDVEWMRLGPKSYQALDDHRQPWWLAPWRLAYADACPVVTAAIQSGLLVWHVEQSPAGYDFRAFWQIWKATVPDSSPHRPVKLTARPDGKQPVKPAEDAIGSLLPWLFACAECFSDDEHALVRVSPEVRAALLGIPPADPKDAWPPQAHRSYRARAQLFLPEHVAAFAIAPFPKRERIVNGKKETIVEHKVIVVPGRRQVKPLPPYPQVQRRGRPPKEKPTSTGEGQRP